MLGRQGLWIRRIFCWIVSLYTALGIIWSVALALFQVSLMPRGRMCALPSAYMDSP